MKFLMIAGFADDVIPFRGDLLDAVRARGFEVHLALPDLVPGSPLEKIFLGKGIVLHYISMQRVAMNPFADLRTLGQLIRLINKIKPDIVFAYLIKCVIYGMIAATLLRAPRRFALITGLGYAFQGEGKRRFLQKVVQSLYTIALRGTHKTFFQNHDDLALFKHLGVLNANALTCVVNGSGVNMEYYALAPLPEGQPRFLTIARFLVEKGIREYAGAAKIVKTKYPEVRFAAVGWLDENPNSIKQSEIDTWTAEGTLENVGRLKDVRLAIADSSVYVLPSYREGIPRSALEAMSMGRGVITTNAVGCKETVLEGENGFLVPVRSINKLAEAMLKFVEDPELIKRFGERSYEITKEKYDVQKVNEVMLKEMDIL